MKINKSFLKTTLSTVLLTIVFVISGCAQESHNEEESEESGTQFTKTEGCNDVKKGIKLILKYDESVSAFVGTVENISTKVIKKVRVEVHLSNGVELGPTKRIKLVPGEKADIRLSAENQIFKTWSTHAECGNSEHSHGENGENHEKREKGEHGERGEHN